MPLNKYSLISILFTVASLLPIGSVCAQTGYYNQVSMLNGKKKVVIPFRYVHNFIIIEATIYGILPVQFIFDTGAEHVILFKRTYTDMLQVPYDRRIPVLGSDLSREIWALITRNGVIELDGLEPRPFDMLVLEEDYFNLDEMIGTPVSGILGGGFFKDLIINIDYKKKRITLHDPKYFEAPDDFITLPIRLKANKPYILADANLMDGTTVQVDLLLDTGAGVPLLLHTNSHPSLHLPDQFIKGKLGMGLGGYLEGHIGRIQKLSLGAFEFQGILTSFQNVSEHWLLDDNKFRNGIIGNELLSRFNVYFDYLKGQIMLKPYQNVEAPFIMDRSGMILFAYGADFRQFVVHEIIEGSPAADADIRKDDILLRIRGTSSSLFTLEGINRILQKKEGKSIRLRILRGKEEMRKQILLRDLI